jgi:hypothetical protein
MSIRVYVVGIHFRHHIDFVPNPDLTDPNTKTQYMSGASVFAAAAAKWHLRYKLTTSPPSVVAGHINYLSYTPDSKQDNEHVDPGSSPRVTFAQVAPTTDPAGKVFPFFGQPLSLIEVLKPLGEISQVLQYTVQSLDCSKPNPSVFIPKAANTATPGAPGIIGPGNDSRSSFGFIGIPDESEIRIRLLNIYCTY